MLNSFLLGWNLQRNNTNRLSPYRYKYIAISVLIYNYKDIEIYINLSRYANYLSIYLSLPLSNKKRETYFKELAHMIIGADMSKSTKQASRLVTMVRVDVAVLCLNFARKRAGN